jgi:hypothetical protein
MILQAKKKIQFSASQHLLLQCVTNLEGPPLATLKEIIKPEYLHLQQLLSVSKNSNNLSENSVKISPTKMEAAMVPLEDEINDNNKNKNGKEEIENKEVEKKLIPSGSRLSRWNEKFKEKFITKPTFVQEVKQKKKNWLFIFIFFKM